MRSCRKWNRFPSFALGSGLTCGIYNCISSSVMMFYMVMTLNAVCYARMPSTQAFSGMLNRPVMATLMTTTDMVLACPLVLVICLVMTDFILKNVLRGSFEMKCKFSSD